MMTSMYSSNRSASSHTNLKDGLKEIQSKKEALTTLESALKKRLCELRELCLKEGELTGHLPIDYPLQPREPIPQIRRKISQSNNNLTDTNSIIPPYSQRLRTTHNSKQEFIQPHAPSFNAIPSNASLPLPSRPTSTNSTSSSNSTASSNTRSANTNLINNNVPSRLVSSSLSSSSSSAHHSIGDEPNLTNNNHYNNVDQRTTIQHNRLSSNPHEQSNLPSNFRRNLNLNSTTSAPTFDTDSLGHMRASSTASSSSSSGSGNSSTISAPVTNSILKLPINSLNLNNHARSCSESITSNQSLYLTNSRNHQLINLVRQMSSDNHINATNLDCPPPRPPRGFSLTNNSTSDKTTDQHPSENRNKVNYNSQYQRPVDITNLKPLQHFNSNGTFQPYIEETKPFQMSDFYKYSSKHRQKINESQKSTRQLQEEVLRKNPLKFSACDDQIQASVKLIEKSGQKFLEATAKAIAGNPGLAERIHNILPSNNDHI